MWAGAAIVGGTGVGERLAELGGTPVHVPTRFGLMRCRIVRIGSERVALVQRHASGHRLAPHLVSYRAIAEGCRTLGVTRCYSTAAVGALSADARIGELWALSGFIDVSGRPSTRFLTEVRHVDFTHPFNEELRGGLLASAAAKRIPCRDGGVYVGVAGPRYETPDEIAAFARLGGDVVGMTAASEAIAMGEAEIPYACLAIVTNHAAGVSEKPLSHDEVVAVMRSAAGDALDVILGSLESGGLE